MNELSGRIQEVDLADHMSDPVLLQRDTGRSAYQLASLSDDIEMGVTFIVRGMDLLPSSLCQLHLADRLGLSSFQRSRFLHHPLLLDSEGQKRSKSAGGPRGTLRESGIHPHKIRDAVIRYLEGKDGHFIA
jgi:glutamyl/glutaminyl-tRNA synthetase